MINSAECYNVNSFFMFYPFMKLFYFNNACSISYCIIRPKKINNMFLRHVFLENDAGGRLFILIFFE